MNKRPRENERDVKKGGLMDYNGKRETVWVNVKRKNIIGLMKNNQKIRKIL